MNKQSTEEPNPQSQKDPGTAIYFGRQRLGYRAVLGIFGAIASFLFVLAAILSTAYHQARPQDGLSERRLVEKPVVMAERHEATDMLISQLKEYGLWKVPSSLEVPRFFIESYPADLNAVGDISTKKRVFLQSLLPHALLVREEALRKRDRLESILSKIDCSPDDIDFSENTAVPQCSWADSLTEDEVKYIRGLCNNYRATSATELLERVDAVPTSIILAQGALESSWGSSRFTREGNSIFGMWTWKTKGIVPSRREEGKTHKVKVYESVLDSVRAYHLTLNRLDSYDEFRRLRKHTDDPLILAEGLTLYSERGDEYVEDIKKVILSNNLQRYDNCTLSDIDLMTQFSEPAAIDLTIPKPGKASL